MNLTSNKLVKFATAILTILSMVSTVSATIASDMDNFSQIIGNNTSGFTGFTVNMLGVFMQPPLLYFVVLGIFVTIIGLATGLLLRRGKRR